MRYVAFLRGVSPMNCKMADLKNAFEKAGFENVKTVLSSGNVAFDARAASVASIAAKCEQAMERGLGRGFPAIVRKQSDLQKLLDADPFARHKAPAGAKRVVTFLRAAPATQPELPLEVKQARILAIDGAEVFTAYVPQQNDPVFMNLIEKTFGKEVTTRTWETVGKCAVA